MFRFKVMKIRRESAEKFRENELHLGKYTLKKMLCFCPNLGQIWTNPNVVLKM